MSKELNEDGLLVLGKLTQEEINEIFETAKNILETKYTSWYTEFGSSAERLNIYDEPDEVIEATRDRLQELEERFVWTEMNWDEGEFLEPVEGLVLHINGTAIIPGFKEDDFYNTAEAFWISKTPLDRQYSEDLFRYAQCLCPFHRSTEEDQLDCGFPACTGNWIFEIG